LDQHRPQRLPRLSRCRTGRRHRASHHRKDHRQDLNRNRPPTTASAAAILAFNRDHWIVENGCHYILDWNWDEDRCTIRTEHGPENIAALRRFAIGVIRSTSRVTVAATIQRLARNVRLVFDYLRMTDNSRYRPPSLQVQAG
jgi:hypothetical protein